MRKFDRTYKTYSVVDWRTYLDPTNNHRVTSFLKHNGTNTFKELIKSIEEAYDEDIPMIVVLVHPNVTSLSLIKQSDYVTVLKHSLKYFEFTENYKYCSDVVKIIKKVSKKKVIKIEK